MLESGEPTDELHALPPKHRVAFAASCCERLLPNYRAFSVMEGWGNQRILRQALDEVWEFLAGAHLDESHVREIVQSIGLVTPDMDVFSSAFSSAALDAAVALRRTVEACADGKLEHVARVARLSRDTIDMYITIVDDPVLTTHMADPSFDEWIARHPLLLAELEKQRQDINDLKSRTVLDADFLDRLRRSSVAHGIQPFLRGLVKEPRFA